jgi:tetratricopeptide (TPR) repeat protein
MNRQQRRAQARAASKAAIRSALPTAMIAQMLSAAIHHHQSGRLAEAEGLYRRILEADAGHADALHLLGVIAHQIGRNSIAVDLIGKAIAINGTVVPYYLNRGAALKALGRLDAALTSYDAALRIKPDSADAHYNRGTALYDLGRLDDALASYNAALRIHPDLAEAHSNRGTVLQDLGRLDDALASYDAALRIKPDLAETHSNRGTALKDVGRLDEALASYDAALKIKPALAEASYNRANVLKDLGRLDDALVSYDAALRIKPDYAEAHSNRGNALKDLGRLDDALAAHDAALRIRPGDAEAHYNRGNTLTDLGRADEALIAYDAALRIKPDYVETHVNRGNALKDLGRLGDAMVAYDSALQIKPDLADAHYNRGMVHLLLGHFEDGWPGYEYRWHSAGIQGGKQRHEDSPRWQGEPANGRTILLWAEQGLGDAIQFARYVPLLVQRGWRVVLEVPSPLVRLLAGTAGATVIPIGEPLPYFEVQCPLLSLPLGFATTVTTIPTPGPYLAVRQDAVASWSDRLPRDGLRVGIAWQGSPDHKNDRNRSFRLEQFSRIAGLSGVHLISLQKGAGADQLASLAPGVAIHALGPDYDGGDFLDTAAVVLGLDLVISADTSVAHLAGTLGRPVWVALPAAPDWRWLIERDDSPWYPTMRLFRQAKPRDWNGVFARIAEELSGFQRIAQASSGRGTGGHTAQ